MFHLHSDANLTVIRLYITDALGNPLRSTDLPYTEQQWLGSLDSSESLKDGLSPGGANVTLPIKHAVSEWAPGVAIGAAEERRTTAHNGYVYAAQAAGTTGVSEPVWPTTIGGTVVDNDITWECVRRTMEPESMKLSLTEIGLDSAVGGATLDLGVTAVPGGLLNSIEVWVRIENVAALVNVAEVYIDGSHLVAEAA